MLRRFFSYKNQVNFLRGYSGLLAGWLAVTDFHIFVLVEIESCCVIFHVNLWTNSAKTLF